MPDERKQRGVRTAIALGVAALAALAGVVVSWLRRTPPAADQPTSARPIAAPPTQ